LGFIGARRGMARRMPGRIAARAADAGGRAGFVLSLQAREQHIRREKATSNICTNSALCALRAHVYLSLLGKEGLREAASLCHSKAVYARGRIGSIPSVKVADAPIFNEFLAELPIDALECVRAMAGRGFAAGIPIRQYHAGEVGYYSEGDDRSENALLVAVTEKRTTGEIDDFADNLEKVLCR
jgi:glycine dehydrogenase subunit 1